MLGNLKLPLAFGNFLALPALVPNAGELALHLVDSGLVYDASPKGLAIELCCGVQIYIWVKRDEACPRAIFALK
jgi:hypothetical protein